MMYIRFYFKVINTYNELKSVFNEFDYSLTKLKPLEFQNFVVIICLLLTPTGVSGGNQWIQEAVGVWRIR